MARARNIKPGFFLNEELVELPFSTRLLYIGLWTIADREGRLEDKPKRIKMAIFPADDVDVNHALNELQKAGFLLRYTANSVEYIQILMFKKHQNPHKDEKFSVIPAPALHGAGTVQEQGKGDASTMAIGLIPDSFNPLTDSLKKKSSDVDFERAWAEYPKRPGSSKTDALRAWNARIKAGISPEDMIDGVMRYARYVVVSKTEPQFIKHAATFFGPGLHYKADWSVKVTSGKVMKFDPTAHVNRNRNLGNERPIDIDEYGEPV